MYVSKSIGTKLGRVCSLVIIRGITCFLSFLPMSTVVAATNVNIEVIDADGQVGQYTSLDIDGQDQPCVTMTQMVRFFSMLL